MVHQIDAWLSRGSDRPDTLEEAEAAAVERADEDYHRLCLDHAVCGEDPPSYEACLWWARRNLGLEAE